MLRRLATATVLCAALIAGAGCAGRTVTPPATPATGTDAAPSASAGADRVTQMTLDEKRSLVASNFPVEVPLPMGEVSRGQAQGDTAWDYEIVVVGAPVSAVAAWYKEFYLARSWRVAGEESPSEGAVTLTLVKNGAQSRIVIEPDGASNARASGVLGVGTQVLQTQ